MNHDTKKKQPNKKQAPHVYGEFIQDKRVSLADALWNPWVSVAALATFIEKNKGERHQIAHQAIVSQHIFSLIT